MGRWDDRICIVIVNWNGKEDTLRCLDSLSRCSYPKFVIHIVDNNSSDNSVAAIRKAYPRALIAEEKMNLGFAGGNNVAIKWALSKSFDWIFLLNNDTIVAPDVMECFLAAAQQNQTAKIFGAKILRFNQRQTIDHLGGKWNPYDANFCSLHANEIDRPIAAEPVDYVCGAALFMHRSVPETIGLLEPKFFLFWEETDYCFRARRRGFEVWTCPEARVWHKGSSSFSGGKPHMSYFWWRSRLLWVERNLPFAERNVILRRIIYPELWKLLRHRFYRGLQSFFLFRKNPAFLIKKKRLSASLLGAYHYFISRFGDCPTYLSRDKSPKKQPSLRD